MKEIWKQIDGWEGYKISNFGNVRGKRVENLHQQLTNCGYKIVHLSNGNTVKWLSVHRLVAEAFIPNPDNLPEVNHKDENKSNNRADNLEWCTHSYNNKYNNKSQRMLETKRKLGIPIVSQSAIDGHIKALSKRVICEETGEIFNSASDASRSMGFTVMAVMNAIRFNRKSGGYHWRYLDD